MYPPALPATCFGRWISYTPCIKKWAGITDVREGARRLGLHGVPANIEDDVWVPIIPAIQRYLHSCGVGVKAPEIPVLPNVSEPFTEPAPKAPTPADNVVSFSPGAGIAEANADMRKKRW